jgi:hypothetical protein
MKTMGRGNNAPHILNHVTKWSRVISRKHWSLYSRGTFIISQISVVIIRDENRDSSVSVENRLRAEWPGFDSQRGQWCDFSLPHRVQTNSGALLASYPMYTGLFPRRWSGRGVKLTIHLLVVWRIRIGGAIAPHPNTSSRLGNWLSNGYVLLNFNFNLPLSLSE